LRDDLTKNLNQPATQSAGTAQERSAAAAANARPKQAASLQTNGTGMSVGVQTEIAVGTILPVDRKTLEGSTPGDHRSQTVGKPVLPIMVGPRDDVPQSNVMSEGLN
jgi:hypothetical protein